MAKVKRAERLIRLKCSVCKRVFYAHKNKKKVERKIELKKYCPKCRKHTLHKEAKKYPPPFFVFLFSFRRPSAVSSINDYSFIDETAPLIIL